MECSCGRTERIKSAKYAYSVKFVVDRKASQPHPHEYARHHQRHYAILSSPRLEVVAHSWVPVGGMGLLVGNSFTVHNKGMQPNWTSQLSIFDTTLVTNRTDLTNSS